jgi:hypothetical protein
MRQKMNAPDGAITGRGIMTARRLVVGAFSAAVFLSMFAVITDASAEMRKKGPTCKSAAEPSCNLFLKATCEKKNRCGGCQKWVCKP